MKLLKLHYPSFSLKGKATLPFSKSEFNRYAIIKAIVNKHALPSIQDDLPNDSLILLKALNKSDSDTINIEDAGTAMRFLTAYFCIGNKTITLTGNERMKERPIQQLVEALNTIGANIAYTDKHGFPPIHIEPIYVQKTNEIHVSAEVSSQFISSLMLIAPALPDGLKIITKDKRVSEAYIHLTAECMKKCGVEVILDDRFIHIAHQSYRNIFPRVYADWSAAAYIYSWAVLSNMCEVIIPNIDYHSLQGDSVVKEWFAEFGIETTKDNNGIILSKKSNRIPTYFEKNFLSYPDLVQPMACLCAILNIPFRAQGIQTLFYKETNRAEALKVELAKVGKKVSYNSDSLEILPSTDNAVTSDIIFKTYNDHRIAMSLSLFASKYPINIEHADCVKKSFPNHWGELEKLICLN